MMTLTQLNYFCTACRLNSITRAAEELYVTQPAITSAIRELEKEYQLILLERKGRSISLTEDGKIFYKKAEVFLENVRDLDRQFHDLAKKKRSIRLGLTKSVGANTYAQYFTCGLSFHPQIDIITQSGSSSQLLKDLRSHHLDVLIIPSQYMERLEGLSLIPLKKTRMLYCMAQNHLLASSQMLTVDMIAEEKMISTSQDDNKNEALKQLFAKNGYPDGPHVIQRFDQLNTVLSMIQKNAGTGYFPEEGIQNYEGIVGKHIEGDEDIYVYAVTTREAGRKEEVRIFLKDLTNFYKTTQESEKLCM